MDVDQWIGTWRYSSGEYKIRRSSNGLLEFIERKGSGQTVKFPLLSPRMMPPSDRGDTPFERGELQGMVDFGRGRKFRIRIKYDRRKDQMVTRMEKAPGVFRSRDIAVRVEGDGPGGGSPLVVGPDWEGEWVGDGAPFRIKKAPGGTMLVYADGKAAPLVRKGAEKGFLQASLGPARYMRVSLDAKNGKMKVSTTSSLVKGDREAENSEPDPNREAYTGPPQWSLDRLIDNPEFLVDKLLSVSWPKMDKWYRARAVEHRPQPGKQLNYKLLYEDGDERINQIDLKEFSICGLRGHHKPGKGWTDAPSAVQVCAPTEADLGGDPNPDSKNASKPRFKLDPKKPEKLVGRMIYLRDPVCKAQSGSGAKATKSSSAWAKYRVKGSGLGTVYALELLEDGQQQSESTKKRPQKLHIDLVGCTFSVAGMQGQHLRQQLPVVWNADPQDAKQTAKQTAKQNTRSSESKQKLDSENAPSEKAPDVKAILQERLCVLRPCRCPQITRSAAELAADALEAMRFNVQSRAKDAGVDIKAPGAKGLEALLKCTKSCIRTETKLHLGSEKMAAEEAKDATGASFALSRFFVEQLLGQESAGATSLDVLTDFLASALLNDASKSALKKAAQQGEELGETVEVGYGHVSMAIDAICQGKRTSKKRSLFADLYVN